LNDRDDPITEIIAKRIIEAAQTSEFHNLLGTNRRFLAFASYEGRK
jgi:hypothetical protein